MSKKKPNYSTDDSTRQCTPKRKQRGGKEKKACKKKHALDDGSDEDIVLLKRKHVATSKQMGAMKSLEPTKMKLSTRFIVSDSESDDDIPLLSRFQDATDSEKIHGPETNTPICVGRKSLGEEKRLKKQKAQKIARTDLPEKKKIQICNQILNLAQTNLLVNNSHNVNISINHSGPVYNNHGTPNVIFPNGNSFLPNTASAYN